MFSNLSVPAWYGVVWGDVMHSNYERGGKFTGGTTRDPRPHVRIFRMQMGWRVWVRYDRAREREGDYDWARTPKMQDDKSQV